MDITIASTWSTAGLVADIALLAVMLMSLIRGARKGFTYGVVWLASILAAVIAARLVSGLLTDPVGDFVYSLSKNGVEKTVDRLMPDISGVDWSLMDFSGEREEKLTEQEFEALMQNDGFRRVADLMTRLGISREKQKERLYSVGKAMHEKQESGSEHIQDLATDLTHRAIRFAVRVILVLITFILVLFVLRHLAAGMSNLVDKIPLVGTLDHILGAALNGLVALALICVGLYLWRVIGPDSYEKVTRGAPLVTLVKDWNPLVSFFG